MLKSRNKMITGKEKKTKNKEFFFPEKQTTIKAKNREEATKKFKKLIKK